MCRVDTIRGHGNIGYGAGHNLAILRAGSDYHLVLNPDVIIAREALVEGLAYLDSHPEPVMVAPQGFDENGDYAYLARRDASICALIMKALPVTRQSGLARRYVYEDRLPSRSPECVCLASGCFMLGRTGCLARIGGFDERYFLYFEDYDLSKRIADLGAIVEVPTVRIQHFGGRTLSRGWPRIRHFLKSGWLYFRRWGFQLA
jgi:GT2 family glycosyltransferase